jgi:hypothetical protein
MLVHILVHDQPLQFQIFCCSFTQLLAHQSAARISLLDDTFIEL